MKKSAIAKLLVRSMGFTKVEGSHYFGTCTADVLAGYALDSPPGGTYVTKFALPLYDDISFLHLSLGDRIARSESDDGEDGEKLLAVLLQDWKDFSKVRDCESLVSYIDTAGIAGTYAIWTRYLSCIWKKDFNSAEQLMRSGKFLETLWGIPDVFLNFCELDSLRTEVGWEACHVLLRAWQYKNKVRYNLPNLDSGN
jgi:hypothetical protein